MTDNTTQKILGEELLEAALAEQRRDWLAGKRTSVAELLREYPSVAAEPVRAAELAYHEFALREELGESPNWEDYLREFPEYAGALALLRQADQIVEHTLFPPELAGDSVLQIGDYEVLEEIGRGGMGVVFKALQKSLNRIVALKMLRVGEYAGDEERKRFNREAQAVARLHHPNIVEIYEIGEVEGRPFLSLEFVDGRSLACWLDGTPWPARQAAGLIEAVARAMHYAHSKGVIHRDLKPANILLTGIRSQESGARSQESGIKSQESGIRSASDMASRELTPDPCLLTPVPKITDFGLAKLAAVTDSRQTQTETAVGTPSYMAPEQAQFKGTKIDVRTDVYGLGAILYELLAGRPPFRANTPLETLKQVVEAEPARPRLMNPAVPRDLETVCLRCLQKEPAQRYSSAEALAADLGRFVNGEPVHARPVSPLGRGWRWCRRNPLMAGLTAVLLLVLVGGLSGIIYQWRRADVARQDAVANESQARQLLSDLVQASPVIPLVDYYPRVPSIEPLIKAADHCKSLLQKNPDDSELRIALSNVFGRLGTLYLYRGQLEEMNSCFHSACSLWESAPHNLTGNPVFREWLATTRYWQSHAALARAETPQAFQFLQSADWILEELAEEQPDNLALLEKLMLCRRQIWYLSRAITTGEECRQFLEEGRELLSTLVTRNPANRVLRKRLGLTCLVLGDFYHEAGAAGQAPSLWQQALEQYNTLSNDHPPPTTADDILLQTFVAVCCSRLTGDNASDPYYIRAASAFERAGKRLGELVVQNPGCHWLRQALLENYCWLAMCHARAGQARCVEQIYQDRLRGLIASLEEHRLGDEYDLTVASAMCQVSSALRDAKFPEVALPMARKAAALTLCYANFPTHDLGFMRRVGSFSLNVAAVLRQLKDPATALELAEQARRLLEEYCRAAPASSQCRAELSNAWMHVAKCRWELGQAGDALAAFRKSTTIQRQIFERAPSNRTYRVCLSRCYDRLVHWNTLAEDWVAAADAIREREKLWPDDAKKLTDTAKDFRELAEKMIRGRKQLSANEETQRQRYLAENQRAKRAAEVLAKRGGTSDVRVGPASP
jgi:serine/threonine protein kinase/tetratricopeptide (TPR) repeat protein